MVDRLGKNAAKKQYAAADKRVKGISSIADTAIRRTKVVELEKQYGTTKGNRQAITSVDRALKALTKSTTALALGVKQITVETARGVKNITTTGAKTVAEYAKAIGEDIHIKREGLLATTTGKVTPLIGYAISKLFETTIFKQMIEKMKSGLNKALDSVSAKFKRLASAGWDKAGEFWNSMIDRISGKRGAIHTRMAKARQAKKLKSEEKLQNVSMKNIAAKDYIEDQVPHMASGGYVEKEGIVKVHAAEVVQPVGDIVEQIVSQVNKKTEAKERKEKHFLEGTIFDRTKGKKKDLFGFEKVGESITNAFQVFSRKSLNLEGQIIRRGREEQRGLIKSFVTAYTEEAKQEELPLMERQVQATLELKKTISGERKLAAAAWEKMLYEHPVFHTMFGTMKLLGKSIVGPVKFLFKKRGTYAKNLPSRGTVFEKLADTMGVLYSGSMEKLDAITNNTGAAAIAAGARSADVVKSPTHKGGWSVIGQYMKWMWLKPIEKTIKGTAKLTQWFLRNSIGRKKTDEEWEKSALGTKDFGGMVKKKYGKWNQKRKDKNQEKWNKRVQKMSDSVQEKANQFGEWWDIKSKEDQVTYDTIKQIKKAHKDLEKQAKKQKRKEKIEKVKDWILGKNETDGSKEFDKRQKENKHKWTIWNIIAKKSGVTLEQMWDNAKKQTRKKEKENRKQEKIAEKREISRKKGWEKWRTKLLKEKEGKTKRKDKDKTGTTTIFGRLKEMLKTSKQHLKATEKGNKMAAAAKKAMKTFGGWIWKALLGVGAFISTIGTTITTWVGTAITGLIAGTGGAALAGTIGLWVGGIITAALASWKAGSWVNDNFIKPWTDAFYAKADERAKQSSDNTGNILKQAGSSKKSFIEGKGTREDLIKGVTMSALNKQMRIESKGDSITSFDALNQGSIAKDAQTKYMSENLSKYSEYGPDELNRLRKKFNSGVRGFWNNEVRMKTWSEDPEKYGLRREKSFLSYIQKYGVKPSKAEMNKQIKFKEYEKRKEEFNKYKHLSPSMVSKIRTIQSVTSEYLPIMAGFTGSTTAMLTASFLNKYSINNPDALIKAADKISGITKASWIAMGGSSAAHEGAIAISKGKQKIISLWDKSKGVFNDAKEKTSNKLNVAMQTETGKKITAGITKGKQFAKDIIAKGDAATGGRITKAAEVSVNMFGKFKEKAYDIKEGLPALIATMGNNIVGTFKSLGTFISTAYGDPKQFYYNMKEKVFSGITRIREISSSLYSKSHDIYQILKEEYSWQNIQRNLTGEGEGVGYQMPAEVSPAAQISAGAGIGFKFNGSEDRTTKFVIGEGHGGEVGLTTGSGMTFIAPRSAEKELFGEFGGFNGMNSQRAAMMGIGKDRYNNMLTEELIGMISGLKGSVEDGTKNNNSMISLMIDNSSKLVQNQSSNNVSNGGNNNMKNSYSDRMLGSIMSGNIT